MNGEENRMARYEILVCEEDSSRKEGIDCQLVLDAKPVSQRVTYVSVTCLSRSVVTRLGGVWILIIAQHLILPQDPILSHKNGTLVCSEYVKPYVALFQELIGSECVGLMCSLLDVAPQES